MDGIFVKAKSNNFFGWLGIICGIAISAMFIKFIDAEDTLDNFVISLFFICFGALSTVLGILMLTLNRNSFFRVSEDGIKAKFSWSKTLNCTIGEIASATEGPLTLIIVMKNGKQYSVSGMENAYAIGPYIRELMRRCTPDNEFSDVLKSSDELRIEVINAVKLRKKRIIAIVVCMLLLFAWLFAAFAGTSWKDLEEFTSRDWIIFDVCAFLELATAVCMFVLGRRAGRSVSTDSERIRLLRKTEILTAPLPSGNALEVYTDDDYFLRVTVMSFINTGEYYFTTERMDESLMLRDEAQSIIFADLDEVYEDLECLHKIPYKM